MAAANWIALIAVFAGTGASIFTVWWSGKREGAREQQRRTDERAREDRARSDRLSEHWLDVKRETYVRFLAQSQSIADRLEPLAKEPPRGDTAASHERWATQSQLLRRLHGVIDDLRLVAPPEITTVADAHALTLNHAFAASSAAADVAWVFREGAEGDRDEDALRQADQDAENFWGDVYLTREDIRGEMSVDLGLTPPPETSGTLAQ